VELWKKYIIWEKSNPLNTEDTALITRRVMFAFDQALLCMTHHPDFWYEAAQFLDGSSKILSEKGVRVLKYLISLNIIIIFTNLGYIGSETI